MEPVNFPHTFMTNSEATQEKPGSKVKKGDMETGMINFTYPTIGDGVVIQAESQKEADKVAAKLKEDMKKQQEDAKKREEQDKQKEEKKA